MSNYDEIFENLTMEQHLVCVIVLAQLLEMKVPPSFDVAVALRAIADYAESTVMSKGTLVLPDSGIQH